MILAGAALFPFSTVAQSVADSVTVTFRYHANPSPAVYIPGEFNGWTNNQPASLMTYDPAYGAWTKSFTFKIKDNADSRRRLTDSAWQYKFFPVGTTGAWPADPLNPEQNPADNNNSVLRMTRLFWFEFLGTDSSQHYTRMTVGLLHANADSVTSIQFETGPTDLSPTTILDVIGQYDRAKRILSFALPSAIPKTYYFRLVAFNQWGDSVVYKKDGYIVESLPMPAYAKIGRAHV